MVHIAKTHARPSEGYRGDSGSWGDGVGGVGGVGGESETLHERGGGNFERVGMRTATCSTHLKVFMYGLCFPMVNVFRVRGTFVCFCSIFLCPKLGHIRERS